MIFGFSLNFPKIVPRLSLNFPKIIPRLSLNYPFIIPGLFLYYPLLYRVIGLSLSSIIAGETKLLLLFETFIFPNRIYKGARGPKNV